MIGKRAMELDELPIKERLYILKKTRKKIIIFSIIYTIIILLIMVMI